MQSSLWFLPGLALGLIFVASTGNLRRAVERRLLSVGLIAAALVYVWFAAYGARGADLLRVELPGLLIFSAIAVLGIKHSALWLAVGWAAHPLWDGLHLAGAGAAYTPTWYVPACMGFDLLVAGYIIISERYAGRQS